MSETSGDWYEGDTLHVDLMKPISCDQQIRCEALALAVQSFPVADNLLLPLMYEEVVVDRAEKFEEYIKNGVIHNA